MKKILLGLGLLAVGLLAFGCDSDEIVRPDTDTGPEAGNSLNYLVPGEYYSMFFTEETGNYSEFSHIDVDTGMADLIWRLDFPAAGDGVTSFGWTPFGFAFDSKGKMWATHNILSFDPAEVRSVFSRINPRTGKVTLIGEPVPFNTSGGDIDACGNFYVCGFEVEALPYIWGNDSLWRVDKQGGFHEIGPTGHTNWMDLAFDSDGTLWGTFDNELYTIDTHTGMSTFMCDISPVPNSGGDERMEIMSIAFDENDTLYGTGLTVYWLDPNGSPVMEINPVTGAATLIGYSMTSDYNHGGDILILYDEEDYCDGDD